jgi:uncharacterized protein
MSREPLTISLESVRRLAVSKQLLSGRLPAHGTLTEILSVVRDLDYVQWDPVSIVAPSHILTLWNRVGDFRLSDLEKLLWNEKRLFLHWTPQASVVSMGDYPLYHSLMSRYPESLTRTWGNHRTAAKKFLAGHADLRRKVLGELKKGPRQLSQFKDHAHTQRHGGDWTASSDVSLMLFHLLMSGRVMVVGHQGNQNIWGLSEEFLPSWVDRKVLSEEEFEREAAQRAIRALGTGTPKEITYYFVRGRYQNLKAILASLESESTIHRVTVEGSGPQEERYIHHRDVSLVDSMDTSAWIPRVSLLPPFDNLVCSTARTKRVFGFDYVREQFLPAEKRRFGTYVLPILWGDKLIGRIDPRLDKARGELVINAVHAEPDAPPERAIADKIGETIARLAKFLGASRVTYTSRVPSAWKSSLS